MEFQSDAQKATFEKITPWIKELFGEIATARTDYPGFYVPMGSALTFVSVSPWNEDDATITARSYVVTGVEMNQELMHYLLRENDNMRYGAFGLDKDDDIFFEHSIVGSKCDKEELRATCFAVAFTADRYDDQIVGKWGGQSATDRMRQS